MLNLSIIWHCTSVQLSNSRPSNPNNELHSEPPLRCSDAYPRCRMQCNHRQASGFALLPGFESIEFSLQNISFFRISKAPHPSHSKDKSGPVVGPSHCSLPPSCGAALTAQRKKYWCKTTAALAPFSRLFSQFVPLSCPIAFPLQKEIPIEINRAC